MSAGPKGECICNPMDVQRKLRELVRFGYDVFISYSRSDGLRYAQALYVGLNERGCPRSLMS